MLLNVGCGPHRAASPWWNVDVVRDGATQPDQIVPRGQPLPFPDGSCEKVYLGHLLEHVPWPQVPAFLADVRRLLTPAGEVLAVGPDVYRTIRGWHEGRETWELVESVLEHSAPQDDLGQWAEARHWWNCEEARLTAALAAAFGEARPVALDDPLLDSWPLVGRAPWQCAAWARR